jgi:hypothetical protein
MPVSSKNIPSFQLPKHVSARLWTNFVDSLDTLDLPNICSTCRSAVIEVFWTLKKRRALPSWRTGLIYVVSSWTNDSSVIWRVRARLFLSVQCAHKGFRLPIYHMKMCGWWTAPPASLYRLTGSSDGAPVLSFLQYCEKKLTKLFDVNYYYYCSSGSDFAEHRYTFWYLKKKL